MSLVGIPAAFTKSRYESPPGGSILMTSAPKSAMSVAAAGPATQLAVSRTVMPSRRCGAWVSGFRPSGRLVVVRITRPALALAVDLDQFSGGPLDGVLGLRALHAFRIHVHDHVLRVDLGRLGRGRALEPYHPRVVGGRLEAFHGLVDGRPQGTLLPELGRADGEALGNLEPLAVLLLAVQPLEEVLGELRVLCILHHSVRKRGVVAPRARGTGGQPRVLDVPHHRLTAIVLDLVLPALGRDVDRRPVQGGADLSAEKGSIVVRVVPGEAPLVAGLLPEGLHELDGLDGALAVESRLAALVCLGAPEVPQQRIRPRGGVAEGMPQRLPVRVALLLELRANLSQLVVALGESGHADLVEPRFPVRDQSRHDAVGQRHELAAHLHVRLGLRVERALLLDLPLRQIADVEEPVRVEVRPVVEHVHDVGPRARLNGGGYARLDVVGVDELEDDLGAESFGGLTGLALELDIAGGDEVHPSDDVEPRALRMSGRSVCGQDALKAGGGQSRRRDGRETRCLDEAASVYRCRADRSCVACRTGHRWPPCSRLRVLARLYYVPI